MKRWWSGAFVAATIAVAACIDFSVDPDEVVAIVFDDLPSPAVVAGDTLRNEAGAAAPLTARLFNADGDEVTGPVEFFPQDPIVQVLAGDFLVADLTATGNAGVLASTIGIQSVVREVEIVTAPTTLAGGGTLSPLQWVVPDDPQVNVSQPINVRVSSSPTEGVRSWVVRFQLQVNGVVIAENDTTQVFLMADNGRPSYADTTESSGLATRRVRLRIAPGLIPPDSAVITARASYRGVPLNGSPVRMVLPIVPR